MSLLRQRAYKAMKACSASLSLCDETQKGAVDLSDIDDRGDPIKMLVSTTSQVTRGATIGQEMLTQRLGFKAGWRHDEMMLIVQSTR